MKNTTFWKGLVMALVAVLATYIAKGEINSKADLLTLGIIVLGTMLTYFGKNWVFTSGSVLGSITIRDLFSGLLLALGAGVSDWVAGLVTGTVLDWAALGNLMLSVGLGYLAKTFSQNADGQLLEADGKQNYKQ